MERQSFLSLSGGPQFIVERGFPPQLDVLSSAVQGHQETPTLEPDVFCIFFLSGFSVICFMFVVKRIGSTLLKGCFAYGRVRLHADTYTWPWIR